MVAKKVSAEGSEGAASSGGTTKTLLPSKKRLTAYILAGHEVSIRPAPVERDWMDASVHHFAYRCLPLNIANAHGWELLCPSAFSAMWDGRPGADAVRIRPRSDAAPPAISHFGEGILTFHVPCLFRTDPGSDLFVTGPVNRPKDGISPLTGVTESDWSPYTFTMNWKFTRPYHRVFFDRGEPYCHIFPLTRGDLEIVEPEMKSILSDQELLGEHKVWSASRRSFNSSLNDPRSQAVNEKWQKSYLRGVTPSGEPGCNDHRTRLRLKSFASRPAEED